MNDSCYKEIESVFRRNLETRFMDKIVLPDMFKDAVESLMTATHVAIVTGFVVKEALAGETDGPPGALALAKALEALGKKVILVTDAINAPLLQKGVEVLELASDLVIMTQSNFKKESDEILNTPKISHIVAIERPSQALDGQYYSMRGENISLYVSNTDYLFHKALERGIKTIGIGDGGNEVGMATVRDKILEYVPKGAQICATTYVDFLIVAGVSNWGAYGICGGLSILSRKMLLPDNQDEVKVLETLVLEGAVDGFAKTPIMKVDGIDLDGNLQILSAIRRIVNRHI